MNQYLLAVMKGQDKSFLAQLIVWVLLPFSLIYGLAVFCHRNMYRLIGAYKAPKPVISIGNITVGGVGKTPLVIWLARTLHEKGLSPVILIRGYMPKASKGSDEADMLNEQLPLIPVLAGGNRAANIKKSKDVLPADVYVADDAFQHWPLHRDLNVVAVDAGNPFGNGFLLPAGILREPLSALKRADVFVLTKTDNSNAVQVLSQRLQSINPHALMVESRYKSVGVVDVFSPAVTQENFLTDQMVVGFSGIGDPLAFEMSLKNTGAKILKMFVFMDHHSYSQDDIRQMVDYCHAHEIHVLVTTHKDAVKLRDFKDVFEGIRLLYIPIQLEITKGSDEFIQKVIAVCRH